MLFFVSKEPLTGFLCLFFRVLKLTGYTLTGSFYSYKHNSYKIIFKWENALLQTSFNGGHAAGREEEPPEEWNGGHDNSGGGAGTGWEAPDDGD